MNGRTYASATAAAAAGMLVQNCGPCGACSNPQDLQAYLLTASNLTVAVRACGLRPLRSQTAACLLGLGFTPPCAACFHDNIDCDRRHCLRPCLASLLHSWLARLWAWLRGGGAGSGGSGGGQGVLPSLSSDKCLACDEARCGDGFKSCAGAIRRRAGIPSDILREEAELCQEALYYPPERRAAAAGACEV